MIYEERELVEFVLALQLEVCLVPPSVNVSQLLLQLFHREMIRPGRGSVKERPDEEGI